jgi:hypothetical protein
MATKYSASCARFSACRPWTTITSSATTRRGSKTSSLYHEIPPTQTLTMTRLHQSSRAKPRIRLTRGKSSVSLHFGWTTFQTYRVTLYLSLRRFTKNISRKNIINNFFLQRNSGSTTAMMTTTTTTTTTMRMMIPSAVVAKQSQIVTSLTSLFSRTASVTEPRLRNHQSSPGKSALRPEMPRPPPNASTSLSRWSTAPTTPSSQCAAHLYYIAINCYFQLSLTSSIVDSI